MNKQHEQHLNFLKTSFCILADKKYRKGVKEHGGHLWEKEGLINQAINEAIDQVIYLLTLREQIIDSGVKLGSKKE